MKIHFLQHAHFEDPGYLIDWVETNGHSHSSSYLFKNETLPGMEEFDLLIIMGGPMNIYEEEKYPWLAAEKKFIKKAIDSGKKVLGICLGSQLIADALGAKVYPNKHKEIGWFPVYKNEFNCFNCTRYHEREITSFHWHGETFDLPEGASRLFSSEATPNQAFAIGENVIALQFHWEVKKENIEKMIQFSGSDITQGRFVQSEKELLNEEIDYSIAHQNLNKILIGFLKKI